MLAHHARLSALSLIAIIGVSGITPMTKAQCSGHWDTRMRVNAGSLQSRGIHEMYRHNGALHALGDVEHLDGAISPLGLYRFENSTWTALNFAPFGDPIVDFYKMESATSWDVDGSGPLQPLLVVGGRVFESAAYTFDGTSFQRLFRGQVGSDGFTDLQVFQGRLYGCGDVESDFFQNGVPVAPFFGVGSWPSPESLEFATPGFGVADGGGLPMAIEVHNDGSGSALYITGNQIAMLGVEFTENVAVWRGAGSTMWEPVGLGLPGDGYFEMISFPTSSTSSLAGKLVLVGFRDVAIWDGEGWTRVPYPVVGNIGRGAAGLFDDGTGLAVYIGAGTDNLGGMLWKFDGSSFTEVPCPIFGKFSYVGSQDCGYGQQLVVSAWNSYGGGVLARTSSGEWLAPGQDPNSPLNRPYFGKLFKFDPDGPGAQPVGMYMTDGKKFSKWNGNGWQWENAMTPPTGLTVGQLITRNNQGPIGYAQTPDFRIARFDGSSWTVLGDPGKSFEDVQSLLVANFGSSDQVFASGRSLQYGGDDLVGLATWNGTTWVSVGGGLLPEPGVLDHWDMYIKAVEFNDGGGNALFVSGVFSHAGGVPTPQHMAKWNGSSWLNVGAGLPSSESAYYSLYVVGGRLFAGSSRNGNYYRYSAGEWSLAGTPAIVGLTLGVADAGEGERIFSRSIFDNSQLSYANRVYAYDPNTGIQTTRPEWTIFGMPDTVLQFNDGSGSALWFDGNPGSPMTGVDLYESSTPTVAIEAFGFKAWSSRMAVADVARWLCDAPSCRADFNTSGSVTVQDIFDFLSAWFAGQTAADFNRQNGVTVQDIFDFLSSWFTGCT